MQRSAYKAFRHLLLRCLIPHLLLHFPPSIRVPMQHQRHLPPRIDNRLPIRRLHYLMFIGPFRSPISRNLYVVKIYLLFHDFVSRHLRKNIFHPRHNRFLTNQRRFPRHQTHTIIRPSSEYSRSIHLQMHLNIALVERVDFISRAPRASSKRTRRDHTNRNNQTHRTYPAHSPPHPESRTGNIAHFRSKIHVR
jgi:hypothetical protein